MTNEPDSISPTPVYGFEKVQINNIGWFNYRRHEAGGILRINR